MPSRETVIHYAMYAIGEVESHWTWNSVTYFDGVSSIITIGMMQNAGTHAQRLLKIIKQESPEDWAVLADVPANIAFGKLTDNVDNWPEDWNTWAARSLSREEGEALSSILGSDACKRAQEQYWATIAGQYIDAAIGRGMSLSNPKPLIYFMCMYHQSPQSALTVINTAGGSADLAKLHSVRANHGVLSRYSNRYNTIYSRLSSWDGESLPPDFGQTGDFSGGGGDNTGGIGRPSSLLTHAQLIGDTLMVYGRDEFSKGVPFYKASGQTYKCGHNVEGSPPSGGNTGGGAPSSEHAKTVDWCRQRLGQWSYIFGGDRYNPDASGGTDCSGMVFAAYWQACGVELDAMWTGALYTSSMMETVYEGGGDYSLIPYGSMAKGDVILLSRDTVNFSSGYGSHTGLYTGESGMWVDMGGTPGPTEQQVSNYGSTLAICVRRVKS